MTKQQSLEHRLPSPHPSYCRLAVTLKVHGEDGGGVECVRSNPQKLSTSHSTASEQWRQKQQQKLQERHMRQHSTHSLEGSSIAGQQQQRKSHTLTHTLTATLLKSSTCAPKTPSFWHSCAVSAQSWLMACQ